MSRYYGLRTEIVFSLLLLMGAAILFSGMLLLKLAESAMLSQQEAGLREQVYLASQLLAHDLNENQPDRIGRLFSRPHIQSWSFFDANGQMVSYSGEREQFNREATSLAVQLQEPQLFRRFAPYWILRSQSEGRDVVAVSPVKYGQNLFGSVYVRYSLADVANRLAGAWRIALLYTVLYGIILVLFGLWLLNKNVIKPVVALTDATERVAGGNLKNELPMIDGPREIETLTLSFNRMIAAIQVSRKESESHIAELIRVNSELQRTQEQLIRSEKLASVGHLAAGMAHEIGNPLGAVIGYLGFLQSEVADERQRDVLCKALDETLRIDRLVRDLLDYATPASRTVELFDPVGAIRESLKILVGQSALPGMIINDFMPEQLGNVCMSRYRLVQIFINLLLNARDACQGDGTVNLYADVNGKSIQFRVADNGTGMSHEVLQQIFEPFFTTKRDGQGRGLGLAVCQRTVQEVGGRLDVRSVPGEGSEFMLTLPVCGGDSDS